MNVDAPLSITNVPSSVKKALHQTIEAANVDIPVPHQLQPGRVDPAVQRRPVDRVRVDALDRPVSA